MVLNFGKEQFVGTTVWLGCAPESIQADFAFFADFACFYLVYFCILQEEARKGPSIEDQEVNATNKAHTAAANRIARRYGGEYNPGEGPDIQTDELTVEVETSATLAEGMAKLQGVPGPVYVAVTNREGIPDALRICGETLFAWSRTLSVCGDVALALEKTTAAIELLENVYSRDHPRLLEIRLTRARHHVATGHNKSAAATLEKCSKLARARWSEPAEIPKHLADALDALRRSLLDESTRH